MHCILCIVFYALYSMHCILCILFYALYSMHCIICSVLCVSYSMHSYYSLHIFFASYCLHCILPIVYYTCTILNSLQTSDKIDNYNNKELVPHRLQSYILLNTAIWNIIHVIYFNLRIEH